MMTFLCAFAGAFIGSMISRTIWERRQQAREKPFKLNGPEVEKFRREMEEAALVASENVSHSIVHDCTACLPEFDEKAAVLLNAREVRQRWPRFQGCCSVCGFDGIRYASTMHYIAGDW